MSILFGLDLSIACTGIAVLEDTGQLLEIVSVKTNAKDSHGIRLKQLGDTLSDLKSKYNPYIVAIERAFSKHNTATQVLYRVHGLTNYIFYDVDQIYYSPNAVKQTLTGSGKADKKELLKIVKELYPEFIIKNLDESDAVGIGLTHLIKTGVINYARH